MVEYGKAKKRRDSIKAALDEEPGLTQEQLARRFGVSESTVYLDKRTRGINSHPATGAVSEWLVDEITSQLARKKPGERIGHWQPEEPLSLKFAIFMPKTDHPDRKVLRRRWLQRPLPTQTGTGWEPEEPFPPRFERFFPPRLKELRKEAKKSQ